MRYDDVTVGDNLPALTIEITLDRMMTYGGATWDFHRYHYDLAFVQQMHYKAPFVDGQMWGALLASLVMNWAGPDAFMRKIALRYRAMVYPGDVVEMSGYASQKQQIDGRSLISCSLQVRNGARNDVVTDAEAVVELYPAH